MTRFRNLGLSIAAITLAMAGAGQTQQLPGPADRMTPPSDAGRTLPKMPAEQFEACAGIADRTRREACIEEQTSKRNPATRSVVEPSGYDRQDRPKNREPEADGK